MKSDGEWTADVIISVLVVLYACCACGHVVVMWQLRKNFLIALRSPLLACICGASMSFKSCSTVFFLALYRVPNGELDDITLIGVVTTLVIVPVLVVGNGALIAWVIRLLVLYDPRKRKVWGRYVREARVARALCWIYVGIQAVSWGGAAVYGLKRTTVVVRTMEPVAIFLVAVASMILAVRVRKVQDIAGLSRDAIHLAVYLTGTTILTMAVLATPGVPAIALKYWVIFLSSSYLGVVAWTINIKPVREYLRTTDKDDEQTNTLRSLIFLDLRGASGSGSSRVACSSPGMKRAATSNLGLFSSDTRANEGPLANILAFLPLKEAFGEYCQKALCSESFQFLIDASEFQIAVHAVTSNQERKDDDCYEEFLCIVNEYIKDNSNSEINIDSRAKNHILKFEARSSYASLDKDGRSGVFHAAEREIAKMLAENLLSKFKATPEYKEVAGDLLFEAK